MIIYHRQMFVFDNIDFLAVFCVVVNRMPIFNVHGVVSRVVTISYILPHCGQEMLGVLVVLACWYLIIRFKSLKISVDRVKHQRMEHHVFLYLLSRRIDSRIFVFKNSLFVSYKLFPCTAFHVRFLCRQTIQYLVTIRSYFIQRLFMWSEHSTSFVALCYP